MILSSDTQSKESESLESDNSSGDEESDDEDFEEEVVEEIIEEEDSASEDDSGSENEEQGSFLSQIRSQIVRRSSRTIPEEYHHLFDTGDSDQNEFKADKGKHNGVVKIRRTTTTRSKLNRS